MSGCNIWLMLEIYSEICISLYYHTALPPNFFKFRSTSKASQTLGIIVLSSPLTPQLFHLKVSSWLTNISVNIQYLPFSTLATLEYKVILYKYLPFLKLVFSISIHLCLAIIPAIAREHYKHFTSHTCTLVLVMVDNSDDWFLTLSHAVHMYIE